MQAAIDGNGSSNTTTITTIISTTEIKNENNPNSSRTQHHQNTQKNHQQYHQPHSLLQSTLPETEATNLLKQNVNTNINTCTKYNSIPATENDLWHFLNAAECLFVTPSTTPQASPSKSSNFEEEFLTVSVAGNGGMQSIAISTPFQDAYKTNAASETESYKTATNSLSPTSSVIATSRLKHNGDSEYKSIEKNYGAAEDCEQLKEGNNKELLINQRLPYENTSFTRIIKKEFSFCSFPISSSTSLLSITAPLSVTDANTPTSSTSTTSATPASVATTPALSTTSASLLSTASSPASVSSSSSSLSSTSSPSAESAMKRLSMSGLVAAELLQWQDMPQYLQFNPYVLKGYRPLTTFKGCLLSLFYWHNETINILTHAIPIVYILAIVPGLMPWENGYGFLSFCHIFGSVAPWCGSFVYHLFMNIERGENVYNRLLKLDMVGIWVSQSFGALPLLTASTFCFSFLWKWLIIISYCLLSFWGLYKALTASSPWQRRLCFGLPFVMRSILTFFRTIGLVGGNRIALEHVYLQDGVSIIGGAIGAMRIPEKWFPGLVDFYLNSHNIMHVLVVVAVYSMFKATMKDLEWMESANCDEFENITSKVLESTLSAKIDL